MCKVKAVREGTATSPKGILQPSSVVARKRTSVIMPYGMNNIWEIGGAHLFPLLADQPVQGRS
jgi:hypothetical protein